MSKTRDGYFRILNIRQLERRSNQTDDPRWIFYSAMLLARSVAEYRNLVGDLVVYPSTYNGKVSAENELKYAVYDRRWLAIIPTNASWPEETFVPDPTRDERVKTIREIIQRQGQQKFRQELLQAYGARCAISGCSLPQILDAAHITPYLGTHTNHVQNGLLLRTDLHSLWDLSMLAVEPTTMTIQVAANVRAQDVHYASLHDQPLRLPSSEAAHPAPAALASQWKEFCLCHDA